MIFRIIMLFVVSIMSVSGLFAQDLSPKLEKIFQKGLMSAQQKSWTRAINYFNQVQEAEPFYSLVYFNLGLAYAKSGLELPAMAWLHAYKAANPMAGNVDAINKELIRLEVIVENELDSLLEKAINAATSLIPEKSLFDDPFIDDFAIHKEIIINNALLQISDEISDIGVIEQAVKIKKIGYDMFTDTNSKDFDELGYKNRFLRSWITTLVNGGRTDEFLKLIPEIRDISYASRIGYLKNSIITIIKVLTKQQRNKDIKKINEYIKTLDKKEQEVIYAEFAELYVNQGLMNEAEECLTKIKNSENKEIVYLSIAKYYTNQGLFDKGLKFSDKIQDVKKKREFLFFLSYRQMEANQPEQAKKTIEKVKALGEELDGDNYFIYFIGYFVVGDYKAAQDVVGEGIKKEILTEDTKKYFQAQLFIAKNNYKKALALARTIETDSFKSTVLSRVVKKQAGQGKIKEALNTASRIVCSPFAPVDKAEAYGAIAEAYVKSGQIKLALALPKKVKKDNGKGIVGEKLVQALLEKNDYDTAIKVAKDMKGQWNVSDMVKNVFNTLIETKQYKKAETFLYENIESLYFSMDYYLKLVDLYINQSDFTKVMFILNKAKEMAIKQGNEYGLYQISEYYKKIEQFEEANKIVSYANTIAWIGVAKRFIQNEKIFSIEQCFEKIKKKPLKEIPRAITNIATVLGEGLLEMQWLEERQGL